MPCLRRILSIKWSEEMDNKISNVSLRENYTIRSVERLNAKRRLTFVRRTMKKSKDKIPARLISTFCRRKIPVGRHNFILRNCLMK